MSRTWAVIPSDKPAMKNGAPTMERGQSAQAKSRRKNCQHRKNDYCVEGP